MITKYPSTPYFEELTPMEQEQLKDNVVLTEKMDGENTTLYRDHYHARSLDSRNHPSRNWVKNFWGNIAHLIPTGWRVCGENMFAQHTIHYDRLPSYFLGISVWDEHNYCLDWDSTQQWFDTLGIASVPVISRGRLPKNVTFEPAYSSRAEGYVIRSLGRFHKSRFHVHVAKVVSPNFAPQVSQEIIRNELVAR